MLQYLRREARRLLLRAALAGLALGFAGSGASATTPEPDAPRAPAPEGRAWVLAHPDMLADLYVEGELTDSRGNRWEVAAVPGVLPPLRAGRESWREAGRGLDRAGDALGRAGSALADYGEGAFWANRLETGEDALRFAAEDALYDFVIVGVREGVGETASELDHTVREKPFAWAPRALARGTWGFVLEPAARTSAGIAGAGAGLAWAAVGPPLETTGPVLAATLRTAEASAITGWEVTTDGVVCGALIPAGALAAHQPMWALAVLNPEPLPRHDGQFGLRIADGPHAQRF